MDQSKKDATLEACAGALQNLTASRGLVSAALPCRHTTKPISTLWWSGREMSSLNYCTIAELSTVERSIKISSSYKCQKFSQMGARISAPWVYPRSVRLSRGSSEFPHSVGHITSIYFTGTLPQDTSEDVHRCGQMWTVVLKAGRML